MRRKDKITKGTSSAVVLSILIHGGLFLLAGALVVFKVIQKEEPKFEQPKAIERPKMKLQKPKVRVRKSSKPKVPQRIVSRSTRSTMPNIQLPTGGDIGGGLGDTMGDIDLTINLNEPTFLGETRSIGNDFKGTYYDFKKRWDGSPNMTMTPEAFIEELTQFVRSGWKRSMLSKYYKSDNELYTSCFAIPPLHSNIAPAAFGEGDADGSGYCFLVLYKGDLVYNEDITFRFWGLGDDIITVRVDGEIVLHAPYPRNGGDYEAQGVAYPWQSVDHQTRAYWLGCHKSVVGDWITLKAGEPKDMEVMIAEIPGGLFQALLTVEVQGEEYPKNPMLGGPILPIFRTSELSLDMVEKIHSQLDPYDACVTNGPIFSDYDATAKAGSSESTPAAEADSNEADSNEDDVIMLSESEEETPRQWTLQTSETPIEATFLSMVGNQVVLGVPSGRQLKYGIEQFSDEDRAYLELTNPPKFNINFTKRSDGVKPPEASPYVGQRPMTIFDYEFGVRLKQSSTKPYSHELKVEYFAIGEEVDGDNYVLLERYEDTFVPAESKTGLTEIASGKKVRTLTMQMRDEAPIRGTQYDGYLVIITDPRGIIVQHKATHDFLIDKLSNLRKVPVGRHFDEEGNRSPPPRPTSADRPSWVN